METARMEKSNATVPLPGAGELHEACRRIYTLALDLDGTEPGRMSHIRIETLIDRDLVIVHRHLFRLARAILRESMGLLQGGSGAPDTIEGEALDTIRPLFIKRKSTGRYEVVHAICILFGRNPNAGKNDTLRSMSGAVNRVLSGARREALRQRNPLYLSTCRKVKYYIDNSERFYRREGVVHDLCADERPTEKLPLASAEALASLCASLSPIPSCVAEAVEAIFDSLSDGNARLRPALSLRALQTAVYTTLEPVLVCQGWAQGPLDPEENRLLTDLERTFREAAGEVAEEYRWRGDFDAETRSAICSAGIEYFWDETFRDRAESQFKYLASYLPDCKRDTFERTYKGSLQNFINALEERLREKLRAERAPCSITKAR